MQAPTFATDKRGHTPTRSDCSIASPQSNTTSQRCDTTRQRCNTTFRPCNTTSLPCCIACLDCNTTTRESNTTRQRCNLASLDCNTTCGACRTTSERCCIASQACNTTTQESNTAFVRCRITNGRIGLSKQPRGKRHQSRKRSSNSTMTDQTTRSSCRESYGIAARHHLFRPSAIVFDAWVIVLNAGEECTCAQSPVLAIPAKEALPMFWTDTHGELRRKRICTTRHNPSTHAHGQQIHQRHKALCIFSPRSLWVILQIILKEA
jgi:hypothetical protein